MIKNNIMIIGGGISGCACLHYLNRAYKDQPGINITLLESDSMLGGTIRTENQHHCLFEWGPNGYLNNSAETLDLVHELGLDEESIEASRDSGTRFISYRGKLFPVPTSPRSFFSSKLLNPFNKLRLLMEPIISKSKNENESIYNFGQRRFGKKSAQLLLDPMVTGIYGGDAKKIILKYAFPKLHELENKYGSLFRGLIKESKNKNKKSKRAIYSFQTGMSAIIEKINKKYSNQIKLNQHVKSIESSDQGYLIKTQESSYQADEIFLSTPAYQTSKMLNNLNGELASCLDNIKYSPIIVIGFSFWKESFKNLPEGYGYLIPSSENNKVLGILFEHNIFKKRCSAEQIMCRVMVGGTNHPDVLRMSDNELYQLAAFEIKSKYHFNSGPEHKFIKRWPKAIPQYDLEYAMMNNKIESISEELSNIHIVSNYWKGISFNDCIKNAYLQVQKSCEH